MSRAGFPAASVWNVHSKLRAKQKWLLFQLLELSTWIELLPDCAPLVWGQSFSTNTFFTKLNMAMTSVPPCPGKSLVPLQRKLCITGQRTDPHSPFWPQTLCTDIVHCAPVLWVRASCQSHGMWNTPSSSSAWCRARHRAKACQCRLLGLDDSFLATCPSSTTINVY